MKTIFSFIAILLLALPIKANDLPTVKELTKELHELRPTQIPQFRIAESKLESAIILLDATKQKEKELLQETILLLEYLIEKAQDMEYLTSFIPFYQRNKKWVEQGIDAAIKDPKKRQEFRDNIKDMIRLMKEGNG